MQRSALRLFKVAGIQVYLHYAWFIVAAWEAMQLARRYDSPIWGLFECLSLFLIVLLHEFGHAFACRQVGGQADHIILWPLGGIAFVNPPPRPGAYLWSLAAGPLVNVALFPIFSFLFFVASNAQWNVSDPDLFKFIAALGYMNTVLLIFNLLPVYPLDGGQIVRALLWFFIGPVRSLKVASVIGFGGAIVFALIAYQAGNYYLGFLAFFVFIQAQAGWRQAHALTLEAEARARVTPPPVPPAP
jgi:Zn-dependent protease